MALIKCSECEKEVSDQAASCPHCGNPINDNELKVQLSTDPGKPLKIEPELTSKKWKKAKIFSWLAIFVGLMMMGFSGDSWNSDNSIFWMGFSFIGYGIIALIVSRIGAWYSDKRTR